MKDLDEKELQKINGGIIMDPGDMRFPFPHRRNPWDPVN
ncbi:bacteriocin [Clostridium saccharobutylicum]|uniref:Bacteriocin-type signal sequence n=1 Tax=Clostridium saccharobutylicum DSM 13864 TaxID=1345695 RepID=U5MKJ2_CLOSA|nr:bacteriocin [Clostridium saccharobutylicum]AGX41329.1 bacteriocin-type signal sequence [Clostridium saccharobutylicum DSM 13864]AQR88615.1 hypothetical protein CLOSC_02770 [Clostridium saccharobutylicum]AQR98513.1 hypothetical protein CSACC_02770 [Clostridium saccharobutylicum]AQS08225.1 hypothetical protein CLOBY_02950 [Clostridium saccharobutylicum]AQS12503.1 hypothetical protein CLOSACC_02770 [Clostridium saccharobutylicum]